jgi:acylphosphatase
VEVRRRVVIYGRVQGVWFRESTRNLARELSVAGWVRNNHDGTLEAVFQGEHGSVERLVEFCREGPPAARVERVEIADEQPEPTAGFGVR